MRKDWMRFQRGKREVNEFNNVPWMLSHYKSKHPIDVKHMGIIETN
jgi:hypothetical protein